MSHSCGTHDPDGHFAGKEPGVRAVFEALFDRDFVHHFRLQQPDEIDEAFCALLDEGYRVGSQTF